MNDEEADRSRLSIKHVTVQFQEILRRWRYVAGAYERGTVDKPPGAWLKGLEDCLAGCFISIRNAEDYVIPELQHYQNHRRGQVGPKSPRIPKVADPTTVPGAIRAVLRRCEDGLPLRELAERVEEVRPQTKAMQVSAALNPMVARGEVTRHGFKNRYRYVLVERTVVTNAEANGAS